MYIRISASAFTTVDIFKQSICQIYADIGAASVVQDRWRSVSVYELRTWLLPPTCLYLSPQSFFLQK